MHCNVAGEENEVEFREDEEDASISNHVPRSSKSEEIFWWAHSALKPTARLSCTE